MGNGKASGSGGPITIGGFAGFGFGVFWYAWAKAGFWKAVLYARGSHGWATGLPSYSSWVSDRDSRTYC